MTKYDPDIHHRRSIRLKGRDYSQPGWYFVTICTHNKWYLFGKIENDEMVLNEFGKIAKNEWLKTSQLRDNVELYEYVIMPNHIHGIIRIVGAYCNTPVSQSHGNTPVPNINKSSFRSPSNNIGAIMRGYKSSVTRQINMVRASCNMPQQPVWQRNYYEHIIRDEESYGQISQYIRTNPQKWQEDKYYEQKTQQKENRGTQ